MVAKPFVFFYMSVSLFRTCDAILHPDEKTQFLANKAFFSKLNYLKQISFLQKSDPDIKN